MKKPSDFEQEFGISEWAAIGLSYVALVALWTLFLTGTWPFSGAHHEWWLREVGVGTSQPFHWGALSARILGFSYIVDFLLLTLIGWAVVLWAGLDDIKAAAAASIASLAWILLLFASLNYEFGARTNFSSALSRLDAVYLATGIVSTAGFSYIEPISDTARRLLTLEMMTDLALIVIGLAVYLSLVKQQVKRVLP
jgi:hypothetical protein